MDKLWYIYTMECYAAIKRNELMIQIIDLQQHGHISKALSWVTQSHKVTHCMSPFMRYWLEDNRSVVVRGWGCGGVRHKGVSGVMDDSVSWLWVWLHTSMHVLRPTDLYAITTTKSRSYLVYVKMKDIALWLFWPLGILFWSVKQKPDFSIRWFVPLLQKIPKCHLLAATGAVSLVW